MILAFDTYYTETEAKTVCIGFEKWQDATIAQVWDETLNDVADYESGAFYKRELPCILSLLGKIQAQNCQIDFIVIDGFVILDDHGKWGLGGYLFDALGQTIPIIGVAKTDFAQNKIHKMEALRGKSEKPLYITALGVELTDAKTYIEAMYGAFRIPTLLKELDRMTRMQ